jgi:hypothetical protein
MTQATASSLILFVDSTDFSEWVTNQSRRTVDDAITRSGARTVRVCRSDSVRFKAIAVACDRGAPSGSRNEKKHPWLRRRLRHSGPSASSLDVPVDEPLLTLAARCDRGGRRRRRWKHLAVGRSLLLSIVVINWASWDLLILIKYFQGKDLWIYGANSRM